MITIFISPVLQLCVIKVDSIEKKMLIYYFPPHLICRLVLNFMRQINSCICICFLTQYKFVSVKLAEDVKANSFAKDTKVCAISFLLTNFKRLKVMKFDFFLYI